MELEYKVSTEAGLCNNKNDFCDVRFRFHNAGKLLANPEVILGQGEPAIIEDVINHEVMHYVLYKIMVEEYTTHPPILDTLKLTDEEWLRILKPCHQYDNVSFFVFEYLKLCEVGGWLLEDYNRRLNELPRVGKK